MRLKNSLIWILSVLLCTSVILNIHQYNNRETQYTEVIVRDTVVDVVRNYDTIYLANTVYKDRYHYDTITVNNIVYLKDTLHNYTFLEKEYDLSIRAMKLDSYKLDFHAKDTITIVEHNTVKIKSKPFTVSVGAGIGFGTQSKKVEPFVGISLGYRLF